MAQPDKTPTFNMKVVVQETGIKPDTLRAWERRYGLPEPERTDGGHRLYSEYDIELLKWLMGRQEEGMSISRAVKLWKQLLGDGKDPLVSTPAPVAHEPLPSQTKQISGDMVTQARENWVRACLNFNEVEAQQVLSQAFALYPVELVSQEVLQKGIAAIGQGWYEGKVTVQQEHFASELAVRQLEALLASMVSATRHGRILVACPPDEQHTFGALMLTLLLRRRGWEVIYLGANVPLVRMQESLETIKPHLVVLSSQTLHTASTMLEMADFLQDNEIPLAYGGAVFNYITDLRDHLPGYFLGEELQEAPRMVERIFTSSEPAPTVKRATPEYLSSRERFFAERAKIETAVFQTLAGDMEPALIKNANLELGNNINAALTLGSMKLLNANIEWVQGLLTNYEYRLSELMLQRFLQAYHNALQQHLPQEAQPIHEWFRSVMNSTA